MQKYKLDKMDYVDQDVDGFVVHFHCREESIPANLLAIEDNEGREWNCYLHKCKLLTQKDTKDKWYRCTYKTY
jgi:hypothetical protein